MFIRFISLLVFVLLSLQLVPAQFAASDEDQSHLKKRRRLMLPGTLPQTEEEQSLRAQYAETLGQQKQRLKDGSEKKYNSGEGIRFVGSVEDLTVGYGVMPGSEIPELELHTDHYEEMREIGVAVKVMLGYLNGGETLTPDATNVLVPFISCVVQMPGSDNPLPELKPLGFLRRKPEGPAIVFLSANKGNEYRKPIAQLYNRIFRDCCETNDECDEESCGIDITETKHNIPIEVLSAEDVKISLDRIYGDDHTEQLFVKQVHAQPEMLLHNLGSLLSNSSSNSPSSSPSSEEDADADVEMEVMDKPLFLGFMVDCFSWLDVCSNCSGFLHSNEIWPETLTKLKPQIEALGFEVPTTSIDSVFRFVSQHEYNGNPLQISAAGGGHDYTDCGWDFRLLSRERMSLATRYDWIDLEVRDKTIEIIQSSLMRDALRKPLDFWVEVKDLWSSILNILIPPCYFKQKCWSTNHSDDYFVKGETFKQYPFKGKSFFINLVEILLMKNKASKPINYIAAIFQHPSTNFKCLMEGDWDENDFALLTLGFEKEKARAIVRKYARALFGVSILKSTTTNPDRVQNRLIEFANHCLVYESTEEERKDVINFEDADLRIRSYWNAFWERGKRSVTWCTPQMPDLSNMKKVVTILDDFSKPAEERAEY